MGHTKNAKCESQLLAPFHIEGTNDQRISSNECTQKEASTRHSLGIYYIGKKDWSKAQQCLNTALKLRIETFGDEDGHVAETEIYLAKAIAEEGGGDIDRSIAILQNSHELIKALRLQKKQEALEKIEEALEKKQKVLPQKEHFTVLDKSLDLDSLEDMCIQELEKLGIKAKKFVKKNSSTKTESGQDVFGQDYYLMKVRDKRSLYDPEVFLQHMKLEDLSQEEIKKGMKGLDDEISDQEIYYSYTLDEEFADKEIASFVTIIEKGVYHNDEDVTEPRTEDLTEDSGSIDNIIDIECNISDTSNDFTDVSKNGGGESQTQYIGDMKTFSESCAVSISTIMPDKQKANKVQRRRIKLDVINKLSKGSEMFARGEMIEAENYYQEHMEEWIYILGLDNPHIINAKEDLGDISYVTGKFDEAKKHYQVAFRATKRLHSHEISNDAVRLLEKLAMTKKKLMQLDSANKTYKEVLEMAKELFEFDMEIGSMTEQDSLFHEASVHFKTGTYDIAKATLAKIMRISKIIGEKINPNVHNLIGIIYFAEKRFLDANHYFAKAFEGIAALENFPTRQRINILYNLGNVSNQLASFEYALECFDWALQELNSGESSEFIKKIEQTRLFTSIGHSHFHLKNFDLAYDNYRKAYLLDINIFENENRECAMDLRRYIGVTKSHQGRYDDALYIFEDILYSQKCVEWINDIMVGKVLLHIGEIYSIGGSTNLSLEYQIQLAVSCVKRSLDIFLHKKIPKDHPYIGQAKQLKALICQRMWGQELPEVLYNKYWREM